MSCVLRQPSFMIRFPLQHSLLSGTVRLHGVFHLQPASPAFCTGNPTIPLTTVWMHNLAVRAAVATDETERHSAD